MNKTILTLLSIMAVASTVAYAEKGDNAALPSAEEKPAGFKTTSYFQGIWVGNWPGTGGGLGGTDISITVGPKYPDGSFRAKYSWGYGKDHRGNIIPPGSVNAKGREEGERFIMEWQNREGSTNVIKLEKHKDDMVKARMEVGSPKPGRWANPETYLKRQ